MHTSPIQTWLKLLSLLISLFIVGLQAGTQVALPADWGYENVPPSSKLPAPEPVGQAERSKRAGTLPGEQESGKMVELKAHPARPPAAPPVAGGAKPVQPPPATPPASASARPVSGGQSAAPASGSSAGAVAPPGAAGATTGTPNYQQPAAARAAARADDENAVAATVARERGKLIAIAWLELLEAATPRRLSDDQIERLRNHFLDRAIRQDKCTLDILSFWPKLKSHIEANPEQQGPYRSLFNALLRTYVDQSAAVVTTDPTSVELTELLGEILGPVRIAVPGSPPLTEEAVDAYADMACFLYEQKNPGKTIDAMENRALFASVIAQKYKDAPAEADRAAMARFPLAWSKFKILWTAGDDKVRQSVLAKLSQSGLESAAVGLDDAMLKQVLNNWPLKN